MDIDETENPFADGLGDRGVDDDENIPLISTSSRRGSEAQLITELAVKHLLLKE